MNFGRIAWIWALMIAYSQTVAAQVELYSWGGLGVGYAAAANNNSTYKPFYPSPHAGTFMSIRIVSNLFLESGLTYTQKGFNSHHLYLSDRFFGVSKNLVRLHYLGVPLMASWRIQKNSRSQLWLGGGMNYGFFIAGKEKHLNSFYRDNELLLRYESSDPVAGAFAHSRFFPDPEGKYVNELSVAVRLQLRYVWRDKYIIGIFHDHDLYDIEPVRFNDPAPSLKLRFTGLSLGIKWF